MRKKNIHKYPQEVFDKEQLNESFHIYLLETFQYIEYNIS